MPSAVFFSAPLGNGHVTAKNALIHRNEELHGKQNFTAVDVDITKRIFNIWIPFIGNIGDYAANQWNSAQKAGNLSSLQRFSGLQWLAEMIAYPIVYFKVKWLLEELKEEPQFLISTQAFSLHAMTNAMRTVNKAKNWNMKMHVHMTDMPSKEATHFIPSIKKVGDDRNLSHLVTLYAPKPLLKDSQTEESFWKEHCGNVRVISTDPFPIRKAFLETKKLAEKVSQEELTIPIRINNPNEVAIIEKGMGLPQQTEENRYPIRIQKNDNVGFLMLGSQPTTTSVIAWLQTFINEGAKATGEKDYYFFLYSGAPEKDQQNPLLRAVEQEIDILRKNNRIPDNFHIIPFTHQGPEEIALMMARSDLTITRSGGATSMELLHLHQAPDLPKREGRCTIIHSEALTRPKDQETLDALKQNLTELLQRGLSERPSTEPSFWEQVREPMLNNCAALGIPRSQREHLVDNVLSIYQQQDPSKESIENVLKELDSIVQYISSQGIAREQNIQRKVRNLQQKSKYSNWTEEQLVKRATKKLLAEEGIIPWEAKNAKYLHRRMGAQVVNPEYSIPYLSETFFGNNPSIARKTI